jgi:hypothetical protein
MLPSVKDCFAGENVNLIGLADGIRRMQPPTKNKQRQAAQGSCVDTRRIDISGGDSMTMHKATEEVPVRA